MPRERWNVEFKSAEDQLDAFLADQPSWLRRILQWDTPFTNEDMDVWQKSSTWQDELAEAEPKYLKLLHQCPARWREHCRLRRQTALLNVPSVPRGRPRSSDKLAEEAEPGGRPKRLLLRKNVYVICLAMARKLPVSLVPFGSSIGGGAATLVLNLGVEIDVVAAIPHNQGTANCLLQWDTCLC
jgi:hypothetical protein